MSLNKPQKQLDHVEVTTSYKSFLGFIIIINIEYQ